MLARGHSLFTINNLPMTGAAIALFGVLLAVSIDAASLIMIYFWSDNTL
jgi:hypothetical protein